MVHRMRDDEMAVPNCGTALWTQTVDHLRLLKTQNVGRFFFQISFNNVDTGANRVYIPRSDANGLGHRIMALDGRSVWSKSVKPFAPKKQSPHPGGIWDEG